MKQLLLWEKNVYITFIRKMALKLYESRKFYSHEKVFFFFSISILFSSTSFLFWSSCFFGVLYYSSIFLTTFILAKLEFIDIFYPIQQLIFFFEVSMVLIRLIGHTLFSINPIKKQTKNVWSSSAWIYH